LVSTKIGSTAVVTVNVLAAVCHVRIRGAYLMCCPIRGEAISLTNGSALLNYNDNLMCSGRDVCRNLDNQHVIGTDNRRDS
jgi:hypothetical protein